MNSEHGTLLCSLCFLLFFNPCPSVAKIARGRLVYDVRDRPPSLPNTEPTKHPIQNIVGVNLARYLRQFV